MAIRREDVHKLIEKIPDEKLPDLIKLIEILSMPEDEPTKDEMKAIETARKEYENGETYSYTIDELRKEFLEND